MAKSPQSFNLNFVFSLYLINCNKLGPCFLQLPPSFDISALPALENFLKSLPNEFSYAVEARHPDFFQRDSRRRKI